MTVGKSKDGRVLFLACAFSTSFAPQHTQGLSAPPFTRFYFLDLKPEGLARHMVWVFQ